MNTRTPPGFDPTRVPHLLGSFAPVTEEVDVADLEVTGELPASLDGLYVRNGPNPRFTPIGSYLYPIDGDGMLHGVWLSGVAPATATASYAPPRCRPRSASDTPSGAASNR